MHPEAVRFGAERGVEVPRGEVRIHDELWISLRDGDSHQDVRVRWWVDDPGVTHLERSANPAD